MTQYLVIKLDKAWVAREPDGWAANYVAKQAEQAKVPATADVEVSEEGHLMCWRFMWDE
jgi:hypothetical protein